MANFASEPDSRRGVRFAPSPTGRFHIGNLRTAWISNEFARVWKTPWIVRFEDIDKPRVHPQAQQWQLEDMAALGLVPDEVIVQSDSHALHHRWLITAIGEKQIYPCDCSRKDVQAALAGFASAPHAGLALYSGHCRHRDPSAELPHTKTESWAWRFRMPEASGAQDFIVARSRPEDGWTPQVESFSPSYHWACAIDDHLGQYRLLVRAWDLATSAPLQRAVQSWLCVREGRTPEWPALYHTSLVVADTGGRLEKRTQGVTLPELLDRGLTPKMLTTQFSHSWHPAWRSWKPAPGEITGEREQEVALSRLGLSHTD
ncbi:MAG: glutamate--tRNA ligase family protein [Bdellovibrionaceae bacterium]|nr:glutamate--tRNA ligase family protein [Pseudobdellovibrionaceae bacterium]